MGSIKVLFVFTVQTSGIWTEVEKRPQGFTLKQEITLHNLHSWAAYFTYLSWDRGREQTLVSRCCVPLKLSNPTSVLREEEKVHNVQEHTACVACVTAAASESKPQSVTRVFRGPDDKLKNRLRLTSACTLRVHCVTDRGVIEQQRLWKFSLKV